VISKGTTGAKNLNYNVTYGEISYRSLWDKIENETKFDLEDLYLNALEVSASDTQIHSGTYQMIGKLKENGEYVPLGNLTVNPISNDALSISTAGVADDDAHKVQRLGQDGHQVGEHRKHIGNVGIGQDIQGGQRAGLDGQQQSAKEQDPCPQGAEENAIGAC
jgi:hypothetical protein